MHWHKLVFDVSLAEIVCFKHVFVGLVAEIVFCVSEALIGVTQNTPGSGPRTPQVGLANQGTAIENFVNLMADAQQKGQASS